MLFIFLIIVMIWNKNKCVFLLLCIFGFDKHQNNKIYKLITYCSIKKTFDTNKYSIDYKKMQLVATITTSHIGKDDPIKNYNKNECLY